MSSRSGAVSLVVALSLACLSALIAITLIAAGFTNRPSTPAAPTATAAPQPTPTTPPASPSPASTQTPFEQLLGQLLAILKAEGAQAAFDLLKTASQSSTQAADLCPLVAIGLEKVAGPQLDWASACR